MQTFSDNLLELFPDLHLLLKYIEATVSRPLLYHKYEAPNNFTSN